jgi:NADP-dependent 3-hydroxy acid dehydrogenase YdfG
MNYTGMLQKTTDSLRGQVAVVTGSSSGIGRSIALELAKYGVLLCLVGRRAEALREVVEIAGELKDRVECYQIDLDVDRELLDLSLRIRRDFGQVDILVHSAGVISLGRLESAPIGDFDRQYRTNVRAPYLLTQSLLPLLRIRPGQVVFINSTAGLSASSANGQYSATKHALKAVAESFRHEVNAEGIRVLSVYPGRTATPMQEVIFNLEEMEYRPEHLIKPEQIASLVIHTLMLPRDIEVTDIMTRPLTKI